MGILGLTHDEQGGALQKLPVAIKLAIGEPPDPKDSKSHPRRLDHFVFKRRSLVGKDVVWTAAQDIAEKYGTNPTEVEILFMDDDIENILHTQYAWWSQTECKCSGQLVQIGDGYQMQAIRKTTAHPEGELWPGEYKYGPGPRKGQPYEPCGDGCPELESGKCKPSGTLYFNLERFPMVGAIAVIRTTSYRSIRNLSNGLMQIRKITGGRLAGIRVMLRAEPEKIAYDGANGKQTSIAHILSLRIDASDMKKLVEHMTETALLFTQTRQLGAGRIQVEDTEEEERAREMQEFRSEPPVIPGRLEIEGPQGSQTLDMPQESMAPVKAVIPPMPEIVYNPLEALITEDQQTALRELAESKRITPMQLVEVIGKHGFETLGEVTKAAYVSIFNELSK